MTGLLARPVASRGTRTPIPGKQCVPDAVPDLVPDFLPGAVSWAFVIADDSEAPEKYPENSSIGNRIGSSFGISVCSDGPMTTHPTPLRQLTDHLAARARMPEGRAAFVAFVEAHPSLDTMGATDLFELASSCHRSTGTSRTRALVGALLAASVDHELAALAVVVAVRPALRRISRRLIAHGQDPTEAETDTITTAYFVTAGLAGTSPTHPAQAVVAATWDRMRATVRSLQADGVRFASFPADFDREEPGADPAGFIGCSDRVGQFLEDAVSAGVVTERQARLVYLTRVEGMCLERVSEAEGTNSATNRKERTRGLRALKRFVADGGSGACGRSKGGAEGPGRSESHRFAGSGAIRCEHPGRLPTRAGQ